MPRYLVFAVLMMALTSVKGTALAEDAQYSNSEVGLSLEKPGDWHFMSLAETLDNRNRVRFADEQLTELVRRRAREPLVSISKYEDPSAQPDVTPTVQITLSPLGALAGAPPERSLGIVLAQIGRGLADFEIVKSVHATSLSGLPAAHAVWHCRIENELGGSYEVRSRMWMVPRGQFAFLIGMSGPREGPDVSEEEFQAVLDSIRIEP